MLSHPSPFFFWLRGLRTFRAFRAFHGFFLLLKFKNNNKILTDQLGQRRPSGAARARQSYCYISYNHNSICQPLLILSTVTYFFSYINSNCQVASGDQVGHADALRSNTHSDETILD